MRKAYIVDVRRTAVGKFGGSLSSVRPDDLAAIVIKHLVEKYDTVDWSETDDVILGAANQAGEDNRNVARMSLLLAGMSVKVPGYTVNRLCASGLQSIMDAAKGIVSGMGDLYIAGGVESMTRAPFVMSKAGSPFDRNVQVYDTSIGWRFINPSLSALYYPYTMGETAENVAELYNISREEQDRFALQSQQRYFEAENRGAFKDEIVPVRLGEGQFFEKDEHPRQTSLEKMATLKPAFKKEGTVTAGNSSGINDGAAALIIASEDALKRYNLEPMAEIVSMAVAGVPPEIMGTGPIPATRKALERAGLRIDIMDCIELNEAFASQALACMRDLELDPSKVNVNGGSIAIGHPLGASGSRITATLLHHMKQQKLQYGLATMCIGVGQGSAIIYKMI